MSYYPAEQIWSGTKSFDCKLETRVVHLRQSGSSSCSICSWACVAQGDCRVLPDPSSCVSHVARALFWHACLPFAQGLPVPHAIHHQNIARFSPQHRPHIPNLPRLHIHNLEHKNTQQYWEVVRGDNLAGQVFVTVSDVSQNNRCKLGPAEPKSQNASNRCRHQAVHFAMELGKVSPFGDTCVLLYRQTFTLGLSRSRTPRDLSL